MKGCELGSLPACINASMMSRKGEGVQKDQKKSEKYSDMAKELQRQLSGEAGTLRFGESSL